MHDLESLLIWLRRPETFDIRLALLSCNGHAGCHAFRGECAGTVSVQDHRESMRKAHADRHSPVNPLASIMMFVSRCRTVGAAVTSVIRLRRRACVDG
jgi:hypothetical protein